MTLDFNDAAPQTDLPDRLERSRSTDAIREGLLDRVQDLFRQCWGEPEKPTADSWRVKGNTARSMVMRGPKRGQWYDHRDNCGGDILDFVAVELCGLTDAAADFPTVLKAAAEWLGLDINAPVDHTAIKRRQAERRRAGEAEDRARAEASTVLITALAAAALPIAGTPAEAYLRNHRAISIIPEGWHYLPPMPPTKGLLDPNRPALLVWCEDADGRIVGGQRILVLPDGSRAPVEVRKPSFGLVGGNPVRIAARVAGGPLAVCESPEAAASISEATGFETWATLSASNFANAPLPTGRQVILCPDRDARDSPAAQGFATACTRHAALGVDLWIAEAPEPEGSKADLNDTAQAAGSAAVAKAIATARQFTPRDPTGRFTGPGAVDPGDEDDAAPPVFSTSQEATALIEAEIRAFLSAAKAWDSATENSAPVLALAASPGTGKSTIARRLLAEEKPAGGDTIYYTPTLALAAEAAEHSGGLGAGDHVTRGRSAINPQTNSPMCARSKQAEAAGRAGLNVRTTLCERRESNLVHTCPYFATCAYLRQWAELPPEPVLRFGAHAYLSRPDGSARPIGINIIDETFWARTIRTADVEIGDLVAPPQPDYGKSSQQDAATSLAADMAIAARAVLSALEEGGSPIIEGYSADDFEAYATAARGPGMLHSPPDTDDYLLGVEIEEYSRRNAGSGSLAALWSLLADCRRRGLVATERLRLVHEPARSASREARTFIRATWFAAPPRDKPTLLLDADADPLITQRLFPGAQRVTADLSPNADVIQITDRTFSKSKLSRPKTRQDVVDLVRAEVFRDQRNGGRGVLAIATKEVVQWIFEEAGHDLSGMTTPGAAEYMIATPLHGARWLWFGPTSLGRNDWRGFGTAILIGREELPIEAVEDMARALWGDEAEPLVFVAPDQEGRTILPEVLLPVTMANRTRRSILCRAHPDPRIRAIQAQTREWAARQAIERLRLGTATDRKRIVIACKIPIPGLPVTQLASFAEIRPNRMELAIAEAAQSGGVLRLSAAGLAADAPMTFGSSDEARGWLERFKCTCAGNTCSFTGACTFDLPTGHLRIKGQRGKATPCVIVVPGDPAAIVAARFGPGAVFMATLNPEPPAATVVEPEQPAEPPPATPPMWDNRVGSPAYRRPAWAGEDAVSATPGRPAWAGEDDVSAIPPRPAWLGEDNAATPGRPAWASEDDVSAITRLPEWAVPIRAPRQPALPRRW